MTDHNGRPPEPAESDPAGQSAPPPPDGTGRNGPSLPPPGRRARPPNTAPLDKAESALAPGDWRRWVRRLIGIAAVLAPLLFLASWSYAEPSRDFCGGCHTVTEAAQATVGAVHADVPCLACHHRPGLLGSITYYPTLLRETVHEMTGIPIAANVLQPKPCETCHAATAATDGHSDLTEPCLACHPDVAHSFPKVETRPHPETFFEVHGREAVSEPATCADCHGADFCSTCHVAAPFPHPQDWPAAHGPTFLERGSATCESCHPTSFCAGCHGGEVPHPESWLEQHRQSGPIASLTCTTCHAEQDCSVCHAQHEVHRSQSIYDLERAP